MAVREPLLTTDEVAAYLKLEVVTVRRLASRGEIGAYRITGEYRFTEHDLQEYLRRHYRAATQSAGSDPIRWLKQVITRLTRSRDYRCLDQGLTPRAQRAFDHAIEEATAAQSTAVELRHLLLGLLREEEGLAARVLTTLGMALPALRERITGSAVSDRGAAAETGDCLGISPLVKQTLEAAFAEAKALSHSYVGTEHVLLGMLRQNDVALIELLVQWGIMPDQLRADVLKGCQRR